VVTVMREDDKIPGVVASALVPGQGCWTEAAGLADAARGVAVTVGDEFPIGSITKTFTATVILRLVQEGKLSLAAPISNWAPNVQDSNRITVRMLLDMTSGIYDEPDAHAGDLISADPARVWTAQEVVGLAVAHGPGAPLGKFYYSNTNYILLGYIAQEVTGEPISELVSTQVLEPLHLGHTVFMTATTPPPAGMVDGYDVGTTVADVEGEDVAPASVSFVGAAGAMVSTVGDMAIWARALATGTLLSPSVQAERLGFSAHRATGPFEPLPATPAQAGLFASYGLGLFSLADSAGQAGLIGHNGGIPGYTSDVFYLPARQATVIVLANGVNDQFESFFGESVSDAAAVSIADLALPGALG
jgi:D-alanyl-D-alanine carboxypeptidase